MTDSFDHGLGERQLRTLRRIFSPYASLIDRVVVFGSRATGRYRPASDIDLAVFGQVEERDISAMASSFVESDLPITVDVLAYDRLEHQGLRGHIDRVGKTQFVRWDLQQPPSRPLPPRSGLDRNGRLAHSVHSARIGSRPGCGRRRSASRIEP